MPDEAAGASAHRRPRPAAAARGNAFSFDADFGFLTPGFRLGFPTLDGPYYDRGANYPDYILILPSGGRVELRYKQTVGGVKHYEANDGSYLWMKSDANYLTVYTTGGTAGLGNPRVQRVDLY